MTERKPPSMSFRSWIDAQIDEARKRGEFDNLPGKGKPLKGLDEPYDELWWVRQLMIREEISYLPPALALRRDAEQTLDRIKELSSEGAVRAVIEELNGRIREANRKPDLDGPPSNLMPVNVEVVVERWRQERPSAPAPAAAPAPAGEPESAPHPDRVDTRRGRVRRLWARRSRPD